MAVASFKALPYQSDVVGAEGFEPPPADFFWNRPCLWARSAGCNRSALQLVINFSKPTRLHSCATGARDTTKLYYTPFCYPKHQFFACRRARFRRRNFFLRHFQRWLPVFFQAREPRFMVNSPPTCLPYMRASGGAGTVVRRSTALHLRR